MTWSRLALLVVLYVALDVMNPMIPGALVFEAEDSVEARQGLRFRAHDDATPFARAPEHLPRLECRLVVTRPASPAPRVSRPHVTRSGLSSRPPPSSPEDD